MTWKKVVLFRKNRHSERCFTNPIIVNTVATRGGRQKEGIKMVEQGNKELAYLMDTTKKTSIWGAVVTADKLETNKMTHP